MSRKRYVLTLGVKGARRVIREEHRNFNDAEARGRRWKATNHSSAYTAQILDKATETRYSL